MRNSVAISEQTHEHLVAHLARRDSQEDLCFAIWYPSRGLRRTTALLFEPVFPLNGERAVHGNAEFFPGYFERALSRALGREAGLAFLHSHPARGWQGMSRPDYDAEHGMAGAVLSATGLPLVGLTLAAHDHMWSGRVWNRISPWSFRPQFHESVRLVGTRLKVAYNDDIISTPAIGPSQARTVSAWGEEKQGILARLRVGVVGLGSVGSIVAEALARIGIQKIELFDFEAIDIVNLDRTLHATIADASRRLAKVDVSAAGITTGATAEGFSVATHRMSICEESGYRRALDCDLLFSCVDRPWPRSVLNFIAYAHLIPVIDGGILASRTSTGLLRGVDWKAHVVTHRHRCLRCLRQYDPGLVSAEQKGDLDDSSYIESLPIDHPIRSNENTFAFSLATASLEVLQLITMVVCPAGLGSPGPQNYHLTTGLIDLGQPTCDDGCEYPALTARGESAGHPGIGLHHAVQHMMQSDH